MTITIRDLARKLGLSITTVSRALDGYGDVAESTRKKVVDAARDMGYEPTFAARQLRRQRTDTIGYILPTSSPRFSDPFYSSFLTGLCDEAAESKIDLMVSSSPPDSEMEQDAYRHWTLSKRVDGIVLNRIRINDWRLLFLEQNKVPFVTLGNTLGNARHPHIFVKERDGFHKMTSYLISAGHRRIAFIGCSSKLAIQVERYAGFCAGMAQAELPIDQHLVKIADLTEEGGYVAAQELLRLPNPPSAILGCNDLTALGVMRAVQEAGLQTGKDIAVAGFDGIKEGEFSNPPLTTLYQPTYEIARTLARLLIQLIRGQTPANARQEVEPEMLIRASTGEVV